MCNDDTIIVFSLSHPAEVPDLLPLLHEHSDRLINILILLHYLLQFIEFGLVECLLQIQCLTQKLLPLPDVDDLRLYVVEIDCRGQFVLLCLFILVLYPTILVAVVGQFSVLFVIGRAQLRQGLSEISPSLFGFGDLSLDVFHLLPEEAL